MLPFTREEFLANFAIYNEAIWPMQLLSILMGVAVVVAIFRRAAISDRVIAACLGVMWAWTGIMYHISYFSIVSFPAYAFGVAFVVQGLLLILSGSFLQQLKFGFINDWAAWVGITFIGYAGFIYPILGVWSGHAYPQLPMFGVTPCPVTIFTFGVLLLTTDRIPRWLLIIPVIWSFIGGSAAFFLGIAPDWLLLVSGVIMIVLLNTRHTPNQGTGGIARIIG